MLYSHSCSFKPGNDHRQASSKLLIQARSLLSCREHITCFQSDVMMQLGKWEVCWISLTSAAQGGIGEVIASHLLSMLHCIEQDSAQALSMCTGHQEGKLPCCGYQPYPHPELEQPDSALVATDRHQQAGAGRTSLCWVCFTCMMSLVVPGSACT